MKPLSEIAPGLLVIQIQIQAACTYTMYKLYITPLHHPPRYGCTTYMQYSRVHNPFSINKMTQIYQKASFLAGNKRKKRQFYTYLFLIMRQ